MSDQPYFTCPTCRRVSYNADDVSNRYCGNCKRFADDPTDTVHSGKTTYVGETWTAPAGVFGFTEVPWFPFNITIPPDLTITLTADGKWEGSIELLREKMATGKSLGCDGMLRMFLWMLLREMERDARFW